MVSRLIPFRRNDAPERLLAGIYANDWSAVSHAYSPATDAPAMLRALLGREKDRTAALEYLSRATRSGNIIAGRA